MRNLLEYPITANEIINWLQQVVIAEKSKDAYSIGCMNSLLAAAALEVVKASNLANDADFDAEDLRFMIKSAFNSQNIKS